MFLPRRLLQAEVWLVVRGQVADRAKPVWAKKHPQLMSRTTFVGGSFFEKGAEIACNDLLLVKWLSTECCAHGLTLCGACAGSVPKAVSAKDVYVMRAVLHDWTDDQSKDILRQVRAAIGMWLQCELPV